MGRPHGRRHGGARRRAENLGRRLRLQDRRERNPGQVRLVIPGRFFGLPMGSMSDKEVEDFLRQANWFMRGQMEQNQKDFQLDSYTRFDWHQWRGELVFSSGSIPKVVAKIQVVGNLAAKAKTWFWSWANAGILDPVRQSARRARDFGIENGILRLMQPRWAAQDKD